MKRGKLNRLSLLILLAGLAISSHLSAQTTQPTIKEHVDHDALTKLAWQMGCRTETFNAMSALEILDILHPLNIHHIELGPAQINTGEHPVSADALLAKLQTDRMDIVSYGIVKFTDDPSQIKTVFDLAQKLKVKNIVADLPATALESVDAEAQKRQINIAIWNDGPGGRWANPDILTKALIGRSARVGICADIANWRRCGYLPADCIQKFPGRVIEVRLSDVNSAGKEVVLEAGDAQAAEVLTWLKHQNFKGVCAIGYSSGNEGQDRLNNWLTSANAFSDIVVKLAAEK